MAKELGVSVKRDEQERSPEELLALAKIALGLKQRLIVDLLTRNAKLEAELERRDRRG
jgi:hypothetical protein